MLVAALSVCVPARAIYLALLVLLLVTFQLAARVEDEVGGILAFAMAGFACSAFLPLSISFGRGEFPRLSAVMAGGLMAAATMPQVVTTVAVVRTQSPFAESVYSMPSLKENG